MTDPRVDTSTAMQDLTGEEYVVLRRYSLVNDTPDHVVAQFRDVVAVMNGQNTRVPGRAFATYREARDWADGQNTHAYALEADKAYDRALQRAEATARATGSISATATEEVMGADGTVEILAVATWTRPGQEDMVRYHTLARRVREAQNHRARYEMDEREEAEYEALMNQWADLCDRLGRCLIPTCSNSATESTMCREHENRR